MQIYEAIAAIFWQSASCDLPFSRSIPWKESRFIFQWRKIYHICLVTNAQKNIQQLINCSWTKFIAIIVNVCVFFYAKFLLDRFDFLIDF